MKSPLVSLIVFCLVQPVVFGGGLTKDELRLSACTVNGSWTSYHVLLPNEVEKWSGSAGALKVYKTKQYPQGLLFLITNSHVIHLAKLAGSALDDAPVVLEYGMSVVLPSSKQKPVLGFMEEKTGKDLAILVVDAAGLVEREDYVVLPDGSGEQLSEGKDVVAVGSPLGLPGTQTFGKISALRPLSDGLWIQTDTAINSGNSGGPLFLKARTLRHPIDGEFLWVGVNTLGCKKDKAEGLNFAISAKDALFSEYSDFYPATKEGAAKNIRELRRVNASSR